MHYDEQLNQMS